MKSDHASQVEASKPVDRTDTESTIIHNAIMAYAEWNTAYADSEDPQDKMHALYAMIKQLCILSNSGLNTRDLAGSWERIAGAYANGSVR